MLISENTEGFQILHFHAETVQNVEDGTLQNLEAGTVQIPEAAPSLNPLWYTVQTDSVPQGVTGGDNDNASPYLALPYLTSSASSALFGTVCAHCRCCFSLE